MMVRTPLSIRPARRAILAAALFLFAVAAAPLWMLLAACSMPCCTEMPDAVVSSAECGQQCGITTDPRPRELPDVVAASAASIDAAPLADADFVHVRPAAPSLAAIHPNERLHAVPGDPPLYLYNSAFLI